jgi:HTH-type transcriptional regulator / antitoxin HigA
MIDTVANEYLPDHVSFPGETLAEVLADRGMKQSELAVRTGRTTKHINEIIKGKASITPETAIQLERVLGIPSSFWNNRQSIYDEFLARKGEFASMNKHLQWARFFPYNKMSKLGWIEPVRDKTGRLKNLLNYFEVATPGAWDTRWQTVGAAYRLSHVHQPNRYALAAWLQRGELIGRQCNCSPYDATSFRKFLDEARQLTCEPPAIFQKQLIAKGMTCGVVVAFVHELPKTASGATRWLASDKALIQLSLRYRTDDQLWFTFFHEAAHILFHQKRRIFLEGGTSTGVEEDEANSFAANFLIPPDRYEVFVSLANFSVESIRSFANDLVIAPGIVVGRLQHDNYLGHNRCNSLKQYLTWKVD